MRMNYTMKHISWFTSRCTLLVVLGLVLLVSNSCERGYERFVTENLEGVFGDTLKLYSRVIIIPGSGCTGCISSAENYFKSHSDDTTCLYVFTNYYSFKGMKVRLGGSGNICRRNTFLDSTNVFQNKDFVQCEYPFSVSLQNGKVVSIERF